MLVSSTPPFVYSKNSKQKWKIRNGSWMHNVYYDDFNQISSLDPTHHRNRLCSLSKLDSDSRCFLVNSWRSARASATVIDQFLKSNVLNWPTVPSRTERYEWSNLSHRKVCSTIRSIQSDSHSLFALSMRSNDRSFDFNFCIQYFYTRHI